MTDPDGRQMRQTQAAMAGASNLMSVREAVRRGFTRIRLDRWANPDDYMELTIVDGALGPWVSLWSPLNERLGEPNPKKIISTLLGDLDDPCWRVLPRDLVRCGDRAAFVPK